jgi:hypothetical protein
MIVNKKFHITNMGNNMGNNYMVVQGFIQVATPKSDMEVNN